MAVTYRMAGGGLWAHKIPKAFTWIPELMFCLPIAVVFSAMLPFSFGWFLLCFFIIWIWSYLWVQSGHKDALGWDEAPAALRNNTLTPAVIWLGEKFKIKRGTESYAWLFTAIKGFLCCGVGVVSFPLGYEIGSHARGRVERWGIDPHAISEITVGALTGLFIGLIVGL